MGTAAIVTATIITTYILHIAICYPLLAAISIWLGLLRLKHSAAMDCAQRNLFGGSSAVCWYAPPAADSTDAVPLPLWLSDSLLPMGLAHG